MNFLIITTMMILIFMLTSVSMTSSLKTTASISKEFKTFINSKYSYENAKVKKQYSNSKKRAPKVNTQKAEDRKGKTYTPRKIKPCESSKLNLYPLIGGSYNLEEKNLLRSTFKKLIDALYKNELFYKEEKAKNSYFLDAFIDKIILGIQKENSLAKASFDHIKDREMFLMLCKGSYEIENNTFLLLDYITLKKVESGPFLAFKSMPIPLLQAFFGEQITANILEKEKNLYFEGRAKARLYEDELHQLLNESDFSVHKKFLSFKDANPKSSQEYIKVNGGALITLGMGDKDL
jgi:hypothetical protein